MARIVRVDISNWQGYSLGASHYYVRVSSEDYSIEIYRSKFDTYPQAAAYAREIIDTYFAGCEIVSTGETRFVYAREGD